MARLRLQPLDRRELMSATIDVSPAAGLTAPLGSTKGSIVAEFTPPIGSNKGSVVGGFMAPIGSDKGSFTAGIAGDGLGTTVRDGSSQGIIAILIG
jgi:hypothetical protein